MAVYSRGAFFLTKEGFCFGTLPVRPYFFPVFTTTSFLLARHRGVHGVFRKLLFLGEKGERGVGQVVTEVT